MGPHGQGLQQIGGGVLAARVCEPGVHEGVGSLGDPGSPVSEAPLHQQSALLGPQVGQVDFAGQDEEGLLPDRVVHVARALDEVLGAKEGALEVAQGAI